MGKKARWSRRLLIGLVLAPLALEALYVIGANAFLSSGWGQARLNRRPERFTVRYDRARTWIPGRVRVEGLELAGGSRRATWRTRVDGGAMSIALPALARREFRLRAASAVGGEIEVDLLPPPDGPRPPRRPGLGWLVVLEDVEAEGLRVLRVGDHRLDGVGRLRGGARFQARGPTEVDVRQLVYDGARLLEREEVVAEKVDVEARLALAPFDAVEDQLEDVLAGLTGALTLEAETAGMGVLDAYLGGAPWLELGGRGHLTADLEVTRGWLAPRSRFRLVGPTVAADYFGLEARGAGRLEGGVAPDGTHVEIEAVLEEYAVTRPEDGARLLVGEGLALRLSNDSTGIDRPASGIEITVEIPETQIPDLAALAVYVPAATGLELTGGSGRLEASVTYRARERRGEGWLKLRATRAEASYGEIDLRTALSVDARFAEARIEDGLFDISGSHFYLGGTEVRRAGKLEDRGWWGRFDVPSGRVTRAPTGAADRPTEIDGRLAARLRDSGPIVALVADRVRRLSWLDRLLEVEDVVAVTGIRTRGDRLSLAGLAVEGGRRDGVEIRGELELASRVPEGVFYARWVRLAAAVELGAEKRRWHLARPRRWYDERADSYRARRSSF